MSWEEDTDRVTHRERKRAIKRWERLSEKGSRKSRVSIGRDQEIWQKIWRRWPITRKSVRQVGVWKTLSDWRALFQLFRTTLLLIIKTSTPGSLGSKYRRRPNLPERATLDVFQGAHFWALVHFCRSIILWKKSLSENFSLSVFNRIFVFFSNDPSFCEHEVAEMYFEDFVFPDPHVALFSEHATWVYSALKPKCKLESRNSKEKNPNFEFRSFEFNPSLRENPSCPEMRPESTLETFPQISGTKTLRICFTSTERSASSIWKIVADPHLPLLSLRMPGTLQTNVI